MRPSWDVYFLKMCKAVAERSHDSNTQMGAVIVDGYHRIVSTGYNGFPPGVLDRVWPSRRGDTVWLMEDKVTGEMSLLINHDNVDPGVLKDWKHTGDVDKYMVMNHAELNAIISAREDLHGCTLYCLSHPCANCAMAIIAAGIKKVIIEDMPVSGKWGVSFVIAKEMFKQACVEVITIDVPED